jgi:hypothetical protein
VRRLAGSALLNGRALAESALSVGDRLKVGPLELEVLECNESARLEQPLFAAPPENAGELAQLRAQLAALEEKSAHLESETRQGFESSIMAAERADQLRDALAAAHEQLEETCRDMTAAQSTVQAQIQELENNQRQLNELHANQRNLAQQLEEAGRLIEATSDERDSAAAELTQVKTALDEVRASLANQEAAFQAQRAQFEGDRNEFENERTQLQRRLNQRDAELEALRSTTAAHTGAMTVAITELSESQRTLKEELSERCAGLEAQLAEKHIQLEARQREIEDLQRSHSRHVEQSARLAELEQAHEQKCREFAAQEQEIESLKGSIASYGDLNSSQRSLESQQADLAEREAKAAAAQLELASKENSLTVERNELHALRERLEDERNELLLQQQELSAAREQLTSREFQVAEHEAQIAAAQAVAQSNTAEAQGNTQEQTQLAQQAAELEAQLAAASERVAELARLQEECLEQRAVLANREQELQERLGEVEAHRQEQLERAREFERRLAQAATIPPVVEQPASPQQQPIQLQPIAEGSDAPCVDDESTSEPPANMTACWSPTGLAALVNRRDEEDPAPESQPLVETAQESQSENPRESGDVDVVLSRLVRAGLWRSDAGPESGSPAAAADPAADLPLPSGTDDLAEPPRVSANQAAPGGAAAPSGDGDEESIESYMEQLMKRVRGDAPSVKNQWKPPVGPARQGAPLPAQAPVVLEPEQVAPAAEYSPRRTAPELNENLSAMRELANTAARSAIDLHVRQRTVRKAIGKLVGACSTVTASFVLGYWTYQVQSLPAMVAAGIGGAAGAYWTWAAIRRLRTLHRLNRAQLEAEQAKAAEANAVSLAVVTPENPIV